MRKRLLAVVSGFVHGVGFRYFVWNRAQKLGLCGFVRNIEQGRVEVVAEGEEELLKELLETIKRGHGYTVVESVSASWLDATGEFKSFRIAY